ncbi:unnamed protein product [Rotaria sp. Silwood1]|nr:unnamed protein product [Rotaria sp. Silwood1]
MASACETCFYDELIVPLLQRMVNLEKLILNFAANCQKTFIDGNNLKKNIISHMSRLNIFTFNIRSKIYFYDQMHLLSNEDIKNTLTNLGYSLIYYDNITNNFSGGLFKYVRRVSLFDDRPFEHEFFIRIAQAFPFLKQLTVNNLTPQNRK